MIAKTIQNAMIGQDVTAMQELALAITKAQYNEDTDALMALFAKITETVKADVVRDVVVDLTSEGMTEAAELIETNY